MTRRLVLQLYGSEGQLHNDKADVWNILYYKYKYNVEWCHGLYKGHALNTIIYIKIFSIPVK